MRKEIMIEVEFTEGWEERFAKAYWKLYLAREKRIKEEKVHNLNY